MIVMKGDFPEKEKSGDLKDYDDRFFELLFPESENEE